MRTYYIVKKVSPAGYKNWTAHRRGIWSTCNRFNDFNALMETYTSDSADSCERRLRALLDPVKPEVVRVLKI